MSMSITTATLVWNHATSTSTSTVLETILVDKIMDKIRPNPTMTSLSFHIYTTANQIRDTQKQIYFREHVTDNRWITGWMEE